MEKLIPPKLYKFQSYNSNSFENLKNQCVWFSKPEKFNDPFDCSISYMMNNISKKNWRIIGKYFSDYWAEDTDEARKSRMSKFLQDKTIKTDTRNIVASILIKNVKEGLKKDFDNLGIVCLTEKPDNILMWSHYADGHRGFCLEFNTSFAPFSGAEKVKYAKKLPILRLKDDPDLDLTRDIVLTKSKGWAYEKEWRIIREGGDTGVIYESASLTGIYFGCAMPKSQKGILTKIFLGTSVKIYEMKRHENEFKVSFNT